MLVGVDFCFGKKVVDDVDFAKYDKVFFSKKTFFKKSVFSLFHTMFFFMRGLQFLCVSLDEKSLEKKMW